MLKRSSSSNESDLPWLERLCDPKTGAPLVRCGDTLRSSTGGEYPIVQGIPDFLYKDDDTLDPYTVANIDFYEREDIQRYKLMWSQYVDDYVYRRIRRILETYAQVAFDDGTVYLDIGCGYGYFVLNLLRAKEIVEYHAIDVHFRGLLDVLNRANQAGQCVQVVRESVYKLPYTPETFDLVTGHGVLHHLANEQLASEQIASKLAPGGYGVFVEPTTMWMWKRAILRPFVMSVRLWRRVLVWLFEMIGLWKSSEVDFHNSQPPASQVREKQALPLSDWVLAFRDAGLGVRVTRFNLLAGFFRSCIVFPLMARQRFRPLARLLYTGIKIAELLDDRLFRWVDRGFLYLIVVQKPRR